MTQPRVFIVDDDPAIRKSMSMMLEAHGLAWKAYASATEFLADFRPDNRGCVLLDLRMPGMTGEELLKTLRQGGVGVPIIIITGHGDVSTAVRTMKLGLVDFLEKPVDSEVLMQRVREALRQDEERREKESADEMIRKRVERLTPRERELLGMLAAGKTSKEIASTLGVSVKTVDNHRAHLLTKLEASNVAELAAIAVRAGLG